MAVKFLDHIELGGSRIKFLGDPVDAQDAANRSWVLGQISQALTEAGALDVEGVQDVVGAMFSGTGLTATYDDASGTITLAVTDSPTVGGLTPADLQARANHTGTQSLDTTTDSATRVAMDPAERTKLAGVEDGATANADDAVLLARGNHTGTQSLDTTTDSATRLALTPAERTKLGGVAAGATANDTDAALRDRATHTGTQPLATITGHDKAAHDALAIDAATIGGQSAADIQTAVTAAIVGGAPETLDTLNEIAAALGDNPDVITDILTALALRNTTFAETVGDGVATSFVVNHNLGTEDVTVQVWETGGSRNKVDTTLALSGLNAVTVSFGSAPAAGAYRVVVQGA